MVAYRVQNVFRALADPGRRHLLDRLTRQNGQTLTQLCAGLPMSRQAVTKHLRVLRESSLVIPLWQGRAKLHYLNPAPLSQVQSWLAAYERFRLPALLDLERALEENRPPPPPLEQR